MAEVEALRRQFLVAEPQGKGSSGHAGKAANAQPRHFPAIAAEPPFGDQDRGVGFGAAKGLDGDAVRHHGNGLVGEESQVIARIRQFDGKTQRRQHIVTALPRLPSCECRRQLCGAGAGPEQGFRRLPAAQHRQAIRGGELCGSLLQGSPRVRRAAGLHRCGIVEHHHKVAGRGATGDRCREPEAKQQRGQQLAPQGRTAQQTATGAARRRLQRPFRKQKQRCDPALRQTAPVVMQYQYHWYCQQT